LVRDVFYRGEDAEGGTEIGSNAVVEYGKLSIGWDEVERTGGLELI